MAHGYLIEMDGVVYSGGKLIPGARDFVDSLLELDIPFLFLTNNSQFTYCPDRLISNLSEIKLADELDPAVQPNAS